MNHTEERNPRSTHIDTMPLADALALINDENRRALDAVDAALPQIGEVCLAMEASIRSGGRIFYVGAGTSGRLGVMDAAECPPTFGVPRELFTGIIAGGTPCLTAAAEAQEDSAERGRADLVSAGVTGRDTVIGISASGGAAYVVAALEYANEIGAYSAALVNNPASPMEKVSQTTIMVDSGPEVITGSTRMKAGTTQKIVLNMLSTMAMVRCGYVYENMMVNLRPTNIKLRGRVIRIVREILGCDEETAVTRLEKADWNIRKAVE